MRMLTPAEEIEYAGLGNSRFLTDENEDGIICIHCDCSWEWTLCDEQGRTAFYNAGLHYREVHGDTPST